MKIGTKLAIFVIAAVISLAGFNAIFSGLSVDKIMTATTPTTHVSVHITG